MRSSSASRVFPMPCSPTIETRPPRPARASSSRPSSSARSAVRPANGSPRSATFGRVPSSACDGVGLDRRRPALHGEGLERVGLEQGPGLVEHPGGRIHLTGRRRRHQTGGQVHRVVHHRVGAAVLRADLAGEHVAAVGPRPRREPRRGVEHLPHGPHEPALVVVLRVGNTSRQQHLEAVAVEVAREERDALAVRCPLDDPHDLVEVRGEGVRATVGQHVVGALEAHEPDRGDPVLGLDGPGQGVAQARREEVDRRVGWHLAGQHRTDRRHPCLAPAEEVARPHPRPRRASRQGVGGRRRHHDLALVRGPFHRRSPRGRRPRDEQLTVQVADQEQVHRAAVDPDRHLQVQPACCRRRAPTRPAGRRASPPPPSTPAPRGRRCGTIRSSASPPNFKSAPPRS